MFLSKPYKLLDYKNCRMPKLYVRVMSVAIKFKHSDEIHIFQTTPGPYDRDICHGGLGVTTSCAIQLPFGETRLAWYTSLMWDYNSGAIQLWQHNPVGMPINTTAWPEGLELDGWEIYEYQLHLPPAEGQFISSTDRPIERFTDWGQPVISDNKFGLEIKERLRSSEVAVTLKNVDRLLLEPAEIATTVILYTSSKKLLGHFTLKEADCGMRSITRSLAALCPTELWFGNESELMTIGHFVASRTLMPITIPSIFETDHFYVESTHCAVGRSLFVIEDNVPCFKIFRDA